MNEHALAHTDYFHAIGYTRAPDGLPLEAFYRPVPKPGPNDVLVHTVSSSLNPLDYKLAELNFLGRSVLQRHMERRETAR
jgi:NADPH:quinone reductase-like Zn-dependent oxidoreductase